MVNASSSWLGRIIISAISLAVIGGLLWFLLRSEHSPLFFVIYMRHLEKQQVMQNKMDQLQKMSGKDFDRGFAQMMVNGHREAIEMVKNARGDAKPELKSFFEKLLPVLQKHEDMANDILSKTRDTASAK